MINYYKLLELERIRNCDLFLNAPTAPNVLKHRNRKCANPNFEKRNSTIAKKNHHLSHPPHSTTEHKRAMRNAKKNKSRKRLREPTTAGLEPATS
jgi:hypothetical protein